MTTTEPPNEGAAAQPQDALPPVLARAETAFARGDHAAVRVALSELESAQPDSVRTRRDALARAIDVDPALVAVLVACLLGVGGVFFHYVLR
jgi:hypothetical protein